jgi:hypothetical protein
MGRMTEMRVVRSALLAILVALALVGGSTSPADARSHPDRHAITAGAGPIRIANTLDPGDPGLPPD